MNTFTIAINLFLLLAIVPFSSCRMYRPPGRVSPPLRPRPVVKPASLLPCEGSYAKLGCMKERQTTMILLYNGRSKIDWRNYETFLKRLICLCSALTRKGGYNHFSIRFYGECWAGKNLKGMQMIMNNRMMKRNTCVGGDFKPCNGKAECAGAKYAEYVYELRTPDPCKKGNGGCEQVCKNNKGVAICSCNGAGYRADGKKCVDINECTTGKAACNQNCINTKGSYKCSCRPGYKLGNDGKKCEDINECATNKGGCSQGCINTKGSFKCACNPGFKLDKDGKTCKVKLRCKGIDNGCCTDEKPCVLGDGDCDGDDHCVGDLVCGSNNCPWGDNDDCCTKATFKDFVKDYNPDAIPAEMMDE